MVRSQLSLDGVKAYLLTGSGILSLPRASLLTTSSCTDRHPVPMMTGDSSLLMTATIVMTAMIVGRSLRRDAML
jgi:hypothetical protein